MALDGFSLGNLGFPQKLTSTQLANEAEALAQKGNEKHVKNIDGLPNKQTMIGKEFDAENEGGTYYLSQNNSEDTDNEDSDIIEDLEENNFIVKLNSETQLIELIDIRTNDIIETITPDNLSKLVFNLNSASGILINKSV